MSIFPALFKNLWRSFDKPLMNWGPQSVYEQAKTSLPTKTKAKDRI